jgi:hypothetical protein
MEFFINAVGRTMYPELKTNKDDAYAKEKMKMLIPNLHDIVHQHKRYEQFEAWAR